MWRSLTQGLDTLFQRVQTVLRVYWVKAWSYIPKQAHKSCTDGLKPNTGRPFKPPL
jgi:hypothetical protein